MTYEQFFVQMSSYFERMINDLEMEKTVLKNRALRKSILNVEYLQKMTELEIRRNAIEEVAKSVLQWVRMIDHI